MTRTLITIHTRIILIAVFALLATVTSTVSFAEPLKAFTCQGKLSQVDGQTALNRLQSKYKEIQNFEAAFLQDSYLAALDQNQQSNGAVVFARPSKMRWNYESPEPQTFLLKEKTVWFHQPKLEQVMISEVSEVLLSQVPVLFLGGLGDVTKSFELISACGNSAGKDPDGIILQVKPKGEDDAQLQSVRLLMDSASSLPRGGEVTDIGGNVTTILLSSMIVNSRAVTDADFDLTIPKGTDIQRNSGQSQTGVAQLDENSPSREGNSAPHNNKKIIEKDL